MGGVNGKICLSDGRRTWEWNGNIPSGNGAGSVTGVATTGIDTTDWDGTESLASVQNRILTPGNGQLLTIGVREGGSNQDIMKNEFDPRNGADVQTYVRLTYIDG